MKTFLTAGALCVALFVAVVGAVQAKEPVTVGKPTSTPLVVLGE